MARDVAGEDWLNWFNGAVQKTFQSSGFFDPEGVFVGDGSYLSVPDNPAYEDSVVMWFDEHNQPVDYEKLDAAARRKVVRRSGYNWVSRCNRRSSVAQPTALWLTVPASSDSRPSLRQVRPPLPTSGRCASQAPAPKPCANPPRITPSATPPLPKV